MSGSTFVCSDIDEPGRRARCDSDPFVRPYAASGVACPGFGLRNASGCEMKDGPDLVGGDIENLSDFTEGHTGFEIFEDGLDGIRVPRKTQAPLTLPGMLSTAAVQLRSSCPRRTRSRTTR